MNIQSFYDNNTATFSHIVIDESSKECAIIDSVLDFDPASGKISTESADKIIDFVQTENLNVQWILETHIHADHLTASSYLKEKLGGKSAINNKIIDVLKYWLPVFNAQDDVPADGRQFDHLFAENDEFSIGSLKAKIIFTPGHTPACSTYLIEDAAFVGDLIFMPYVGTARADFPGGSAETLYQSLQKLYALPDSTRIFTCHDYPKEGNPPKCETTIAEEKSNNKMIQADTDKKSFIEKRQARDATLSAPRLLLPSLQVNLRAGKLPSPESNKIQYIKIPINQL